MLGAFPAPATATPTSVTPNQASVSVSIIRLEITASGAPEATSETRWTGLEMTASSAPVPSSGLRSEPASSSRTKPPLSASSAQRDMQGPSVSSAGTATLEIPRDSSALKDLVSPASATTTLTPTVGRTSVTAYRGVHLTDTSHGFSHAYSLGILTC